MFLFRRCFCGWVTSKWISCGRKFVGPRRGNGALQLQRRQVDVVPANLYSLNFFGLTSGMYELVTCQLVRLWCGESVILQKEFLRAGAEPDAGCRSRRTALEFRTGPKIYIASTLSLNRIHKYLVSLISNESPHEPDPLALSHNHPPSHPARPFPTESHSQHGLVHQPSNARAVLC